MSEVDESLDLLDRKRRKAFVDLVNAVAEIVAVHIGIGHDACSAHNGTARYFAGNTLDQLTGPPVDVGKGFEAAHL